MSVKRRIVLLVICTHLLLILYMSVTSPTPVKKAQKPLVVKTVAMKNVATKEKSTARGVSSTVAAKKAAKPEQTQPKKKAEKTPPIADKTVVKKKNVPQKPVEDSREKMSQKLLRDLEESLSKLEEKPQKKGSAKAGAKSAPAPLALQLDGEETDGEYDDSLIGYLKQTLNLPEYGEVKIQLTLKQDGTFVNLVVIKAESEKNRKYLEASLPHLRFPHLVGKKKQETFIVTFCNEI